MYQVMHVLVVQQQKKRNNGLLKTLSYIPLASKVHRLIPSTISFLVQVIIYKPHIYIALVTSVGVRKAFA